MAGLKSDIEARLTSSLGKPLILRECTGSTMLDARELALSGSPAGTVVVAEEQTAGRGRLDRRFVSPRGGLYLTVVLDPPGDPADAWRCGFAAALAARGAVLRVSGPELTFDWPNDLVLGERKVGGILLELVQLSVGPPASFSLLLGLGLNLGPDPRALDPGAAGPAGPIPGLPPGDHRAAIAAHFLADLEALVPRCGSAALWPGVLESVRAISRATRGFPVAVRDSDGRVVEGLGVGLREDGAILIRTAAGDVTAVRYGERVS